MALFQVKAYCKQVDDYQEFFIEKDTDREALESAYSTLRWLENTKGKDYAVNLQEMPRNQSWHIIFYTHYDSEGELIEGMGCREKRISVMAANEEDAVRLANQELRAAVGREYSDWDVSEVYRGRGGYRPGAGRPSENKKPKTVVKRIPVELADKLGQIDSLLHLIEDWRERSSNAPETSPRWERARELLSEILELGL